MHWLSKKNTKIIMIMPAVILFTVFYLAPIFISVYYSFTDFSGIGAAKFIGFKNYQVLLNDKFFFIALKNTFIIWYNNYHSAIVIYCGITSGKTISGKWSCAVHDLCTKCNCTNISRSDLVVYSGSENGDD